MRPPLELAKDTRVLATFSSCESVFLNSTCDPSPERMISFREEAMFSAFKKVFQK
jgi:hypothetical protein